MNDRPTVRCRACNLNQFETMNKKCRRCQKPLFEVAVLPPLPISIRAARHNSVSFRDVGEHVTAYRKALGWRQSELAKGINHSYICKLENGAPVGIGYLEKLADRLGVPVMWLIEDVTEERLAEMFARRVFLESRTFSWVQKQMIVRGVENLCKRRNSSPFIEREKIYG